jgi:hypothetical protein
MGAIVDQQSIWETSAVRGSNAEPLVIQIATY